MIDIRLKRVILNELNIDDFDITETTQAPQVPGWDSLNHLRILCGVEKEYGIKFKSLEVIRLKNVGELQSLISSKTQKSNSDQIQKKNA